MTNEQMTVVSLPVDDIYPDPANPRVNESAVAVVADSIRQFGFRVPLVLDSDHVIRAGHTRYRAAILLGMEEIPCTIIDNLTDEQLAAFAVAENRTSDFSFFDTEKLGEFIDGIPEEMLAAFDIDSILTPADGDPGEEKVAGEPTKRKGLDLAPFEKYQYVMILCRTEFDYTNLLTMLRLEDVQKGYVSGALKRGSSYGRVIEYPTFMERIKGEG